MYNGRIVKIISAFPKFMEPKKGDKMMQIIDNDLYLRCSDKSLQIGKAQFEGKKIMSAEEIINGRLF